MRQVSNVSVYFCLFNMFYRLFYMLCCEQSKMRWNGMELLVPTNNKSGCHFPIMELPLSLCQPRRKSGRWRKKKKKKKSIIYDLTNYKSKKCTRSLNVPTRMYELFYDIIQRS